MTEFKTATETLASEHRVIERMLGILDSAAERLDAGEAVAPTVFVRAAEFFRDFADRCHHSKEEDLLFQRLHQKGMPLNVGPIAAMMADHSDGRALVRRIGEAAGRLLAGDPIQRKPLVNAARGYSSLLRNHIAKEERVLFPMADESLGEQDQKSLAAAFEQVEVRMGEGAHERHVLEIEELERELRITSPEGIQTNCCCCAVA